jgi:hypothetical protein
MDKGVAIVYGTHRWRAAPALGRDSPDAAGAPSRKLEHLIDCRSPMSTRRTRSPNRPALAKGASRLIHLATEWAESSSKLEDQFWSRKVGPEIDALFEANNEKALTAALDHLWARTPRGHDLLADLIESRAESATSTVGNQTYDMLLLAVPLLAWSRDRIPSGKLQRSVLEGVRTHLCAHVLSQSAQVCLADVLFSPDQLPHTYCESATLASVMFEALTSKKPFATDFPNWPETGQFVADTRLILAAIAVPTGSALFRWQEDDVSREKVLAAWREQGGAVLQSAMAGCTLELLMPTAFHGGSRLADRESRAFSLKAGVQFLETVVGLPARDVVAVIAPFYDQDLEEYRISLMRRDKPDVLHGVVWPVLGTEAEDATVSDEIEAVLNAMNVGSVQLIEHRFPLEHCSDCGAPMFSDTESELVHAGFPDDEMPESVRFH